MDDSGGCSRRVPAHPVAYFTRQNPFSRFSGATGTRACKSNARCPLVNLRINTHRGDNLRSQCIGSVPILCLSSFLLLCFSFSLFFSYRRPVDFRLRTRLFAVPEGESLVKAPRYIRLRVDRYIPRTLIRR